MMKELIKEYMNKKYLVRIALYDDTYVHGFIMSQNDDGIILSCIVDYHSNGFLYIARKYIVGIRHDQHDVFSQKVLLKEGVKPSIAGGMKKDLDMEKLLSSLIDSDEFCYIETMYGTKKDKTTNDIFGRLIALDDHYCLVWECEADGKWRDLPQIIPIKKIVRIEWGTEYLTIFPKHIKSLSQKTVDAYFASETMNFYEFDPNSI